MTPLLDQSIRDRIRDDLDSTFVVEAAAGTGKTKSLVSRMVSLVASGRCTADALAAITFTRKAAAELRSRFQSAMEESIREERDGSRRQRLGAAIENLDRAYLGTIHSFCARLIRERPVEAGVAPGFREIEQDEATVINNTVWEEWVESLHFRGESIVAEIEGTGVTFSDLRKSFLYFCENLDLLPIAVPRVRPDLGGIIEDVRGFLDRAYDVMPPNVPPDERDGLMSELPTLRKMARRIGPGDDVDLIHLLQRIDHYKLRITLKRWANKDGRELKARLDDLKARGSEKVDCWAEWVHAIAIRAIGEAPRLAQKRRIASERLSFHDLLLVARDLLRDHPHVRRYFQRRFSHILVDEFQDTDPVQAEILFYLCGGDVEELDWRQLAPRPGSLFIVGDPKQSIYRFRRADISLYTEVADRIAASGGEILQLTTNFRSTADICEAINDTFSRIFVERPTEQQAGMVRAEPHRAAVLRSGIYRLVTRSDNWMISDREAARQAEQIATWIAAAVQGKATIDDGDGPRPFVWADFMILTWWRTKLEHYAEAMEAAGIPFEITGGRGYARSEELALVRPLLRAAVDPDDQIALAAFLMGELCGVDDEALLVHRESGGSFSYLVDPPEGSDERIRRGMETLRDSYRDARSLPPAAALSRIFERVGLVPLGASKDRGPTRAGILIEALTIAREWSRRGASFSEIVAQLEVHLDEPELSEIEEMSIGSSNPCVVRLMNIHQAKGLESPVVFLAEPTTPTLFDPDSWVDRSKSPPELYKVLHRDGAGGFRKIRIGLPGNWAHLEAREKEFVVAERDRLVYVAATRARNMLIVGLGQTDKGSLTGPWVSLAGVAREDLEELPAVPGGETMPLPGDLDAAALEMRQHLASRRDAILKPSWVETSVTRVAHSGMPVAEAAAKEGQMSLFPKPGEVPPSVRKTGPTESHGLAWGRVMHRVLEIAMRRPSADLTLVTRNLLVDEGRDLGEVSEVLSFVDRVRKSDLWQRATRAKQCLVEVPFVVDMSSGDLLHGDVPTLLRGVIDLVFEDEKGWWIVDYKSDRVSGPLDDLVSMYRPQIEIYRRYWSEFTGSEVSAGLHFIDGDETVWF